MDARTLRLLDTLAEERHFGRAAERLGTAQPHVSSRLKAVEDSLGLKLFERRPEVRLTPQGEVLLSALRRAAGELDSAVRQARRIQAGGAGVVRLGYASSALMSPLADRIGAFHRERPDVELQLIDLHSSVHWEALRSARIDLALSREIRREPDLACRLVLRDELHLALPQDHPLAADGEPVALPEVAGEPFVMFHPAAAPAMYAQILSSCVSAGFPLQVAQEADDWPTILRLVTLGFGVAMAPGALRRLALPGVVFRPLRGGGPAANIFMCHKTQPGAAALALAAMLAPD